MVRFVFLFLCAILLLGHSCTSSKGNSFEDLSEADSFALVGELMDSLRGEMYSMTCAIDEDSNQIIGMGYNWHQRLLIGYNKKGELVIPEEKMKGGIVSSIENYLLMNRKENKPGNGFPFYLRSTKKQFLQNKRDSMDAKAKLLELIAGRNRGLLATESDRVRILAAIEQLEDHNPHPHPLEVKQLLGGNWRLLFTSNLLQR